MDIKDDELLDKILGKTSPGSIKVHWHGEPRDRVRRPMLVDKLLPEVGIGLLSGQWGTYKTFVAIDLTAAVISGQEFVGFPVKRKSGVLFIAAEGISEISLRYEAAIQARGLEGTTPFTWIEEYPRLLDPNAANVLIETATAVAQRMQADFQVPLGLVIIDTIVAAAQYGKAGDDNDAAVAQKVMGVLGAVARATSTFVIGIDHFGKAIETGTRGSSAKEAAADVVLATLGERDVAGKVTNTRLAIRKRRGGDSGAEYVFKAREVDVEEMDNTVETTLVVEWTLSDEAVKPTDDKWSKSLRLLRQVLMTTLVDHGKEMRPYPDGPSVRVIDIEIVRTEFYASYPATGDEKAKNDARRQAFKRALNCAQANALIGVRDIETSTVMWLAGSTP
jgi:hypothetical protein